LKNIKLRLGCQKAIDYTCISTLNLKLIGLHLDLKITKIEHGVENDELYLECEASCWKLSWNLGRFTNSTCWWKCKKNDSLNVMDLV
jgi:hypothetical protein